MNPLKTSFFAFSLAALLAANAAAQNSFYNNLEGQGGNWMCALNNAGGGGSQEIFCGSGLTDAGYTVDFYMIKRDTQDTVWLSGIKNQMDCAGNDKSFTCFKKDGDEVGGIVVDNGVLVQTKGMYIIKIGSGNILRVSVM